MGFTVYYRSTRPVSTNLASTIRQEAGVLSQGRTWVSCEPVHFFADQGDGHLLGGSKPNFLPHPDDMEAAASSALPDGTLRDLLEVLERLSREHAVDWELRHDEDPNPIGMIRAGVCEDRLQEQIEALADLADMLGGVANDFSSLHPEISGKSEEEDEDDDGPSILPFRPREG